MERNNYLLHHHVLTSMENKRAYRALLWREREEVFQRLQQELDEMVLEKFILKDQQLFRFSKLPTPHFSKSVPAVQLTISRATASSVVPATVTSSSAMPAWTWCSVPSVVARCVAYVTEPSASSVGW